MRVPRPARVKKIRPKGDEILGQLQAIQTCTEVSRKILGSCDNFQRLST